MLFCLLDSDKFIGCLRNCVWSLFVFILLLINDIFFDVLLNSIFVVVIKMGLFDKCVVFDVIIFLFLNGILSFMLVVRGLLICMFLLSILFKDFLRDEFIINVVSVFLVLVLFV